MPETARRGGERRRRRRAAPALLLAAAVAAAAPRRAAGGEPPETCAADGDGSCADGVRDRGLVKKRVEARDVLDNHGKPGTHAAKRFPRSTLGIITPWHPDGREAALRFAAKLDYVSPLWFHITPERDLVAGQPDTWKVAVKPVGDPSEGWSHDLTRKGPKLVPIFAFYGWTQATLSEFFLGKKSGNIQHLVVRQIASACKAVDCNGVHIEWGAMPINEFYHKLEPWLRRLRGTMRKLLKAHQQRLFLSVHPDPTKFGKNQFDALMEGSTVDKIVYHLYNFTGPALSSGPNAPISWFEDMLHAWRLDTREDTDDRVFAVLNLFGREYRADFGTAIDDMLERDDSVSRDAEGRLTRWDVTGRDYVRILEDSQKDKGERLTHHWDPDKEEHYADYYPLVDEWDPKTGKQMRENRKVYYPSLKSLSKRIARLGKLRSCGLGLYNLGTGLDYFYDLV